MRERSLDIVSCSPVSTWRPSIRKRSPYEQPRRRILQRHSWRFSPDMDCPAPSCRTRAKNLTGKVMTQLCESLHIEKIQTSPYHPESNGCVERLHGMLVPMLKKAADSKFQWPLQLKFCLFAIRSTPNRSTDFSPYEVVYGTTMRTPVDLMVDE